MENLIIFRVVKDNNILHTGMCNANIFINVIPVRHCNLYDYIELDYNGKTFILKSIDLSYYEELEIDKEDHKQLLAKFKSLGP